jgi:hypothetical protein
LFLFIYVLLGSVAFRIPESIKTQLTKIAARETRSTSQQVEHFVRQGLREYLKANPDFQKEKKKE